MSSPGTPWDNTTVEFDYASSAHFYRSGYDGTNMTTTAEVSLNSGTTRGVTPLLLVRQDVQHHHARHHRNVHHRLHHRLRLCGHAG